MSFAVSMLVFLGIASIIGTILKQNEPYENYIIKFGQFWFVFFEKIGLYDVYQSIWFLTILLFLVISTTLCVTKNTPIIFKDFLLFKDSLEEKSLLSFTHHLVLKNTKKVNLSRVINYLKLEKFKVREKSKDNGDILIVAKKGDFQRLGYIFTHVGVVVICLGGLLDGNLFFKAQELLGYKKIETLDIPASKVPEVSRLSITNPSFRANMTLAEGSSDNVAFVRKKDGYLVQDLPFKITLKDFRIEHYSTGMPKSFESDLIISDPELSQDITKTITVNHPFSYKGISIYQSDFQDGGTNLDIKLWNLLNSNTPQKINAKIFEKIKLDKDQLTYEFNDFRKFNILNLKEGVKEKPRNVGPSVTYKIRNNSGQAREYISYQVPMLIDDRSFFISGMRETPQEEFKYLKIPADKKGSIAEFISFKEALQDKILIEMVAKKMANRSVKSDNNLSVKQSFEDSVNKIMTLFVEGGFSNIAQNIDNNIPANEKEKAVQAYLKIIDIASIELYKNYFNLSDREIDQSAIRFIQEALNAYSDMFLFGSPYYFELTNYEQKEASGLQLTKSPGQFWVYLGSLSLVLGIFSMIYLHERKLWLLIKAKGGAIIAVSSNRKNIDFELDYKKVSQAIKKIIQ
ncbi:cytochrome c biogenesis protein ResB [Candidatus Methylopumilus planktonicus]|uniref:cytochrome c biogenesis protein ResB n=1 Tax=Candidatus Methylopumilus planktonicus TaxID=1581557 RepID=UPI00111D3061|nr:cytochrome c biogenesis protein ResB [Candidatus Methylopumilus planktonicus]QDD06407.1 cytochrome c biogenesis protein ResB [Candidatus Methylopumilus planktonicus]QDD07741.1 cytochrome c biogenesis protein ResB [Candidatus Methylopumilus planktonicus]QDD09068.1 cytochrome c biogenesis protein ResB [Candidatus Methylopumilus planktonicus]